MPRQRSTAGADLDDVGRFSFGAGGRGDAGEDRLIPQKVLAKLTWQISPLQ